MPANNPNVARVVMRFLRDTREQINTFHVTKSPPAPLAIADLASIVGEFYTWWQQDRRNTEWNQSTLLDITATKLDPNDPIQHVMNVSEQGQEASVPSAGNVSASVSARTGLAGRKFRGRNYHTHMPEAYVSNADLISQIWVFALGVCYQGLLTLLSNSTFGPFQRVIFHLSTNTFTPVITTIVENVVDSMRRRLPKRGI